MIDRQEILDLARELQPPASSVDEHYALGWLLAGIAQHPDLRESWVFEGGTCLEKCFFEACRYPSRSTEHRARRRADRLRDRARFTLDSARCREGVSTPLPRPSQRARSATAAGGATT